MDKTDIRLLQGVYADELLEIEGEEEGSQMGVDIHSEVTSQMNKLYRLTETDDAKSEEMSPTARRIRHKKRRVPPNVRSRKETHPRRIRGLTTRHLNNNHNVNSNLVVEKEENVFLKNEN